MVGVPIMVDPYNVFHWKNARNNGVEPNKNYIKMSYILNNPNKYDAFLFGSSRVGAIHTEKIDGVDCYNMTYSMGTPSENLANLKTMLKAGIRPKRVYIGIDTLSYTVDATLHNNEAARASYEYLKSDFQNFADHYFSLINSVKSLSIITSGVEAPGVAEIYEYGWWADYDYQSSYDWTHEGVTKGTTYEIDEAVDNIAEMNQLCNEYDIDFVVFTNPMTAMAYQDAIDNGYEEFIDKISEFTEVIDFSYLNGTKEDHSHFIDESHYTAQVGDEMIKVLNQ